MVHGNDLFALLAVGLGGGFLHEGNGLVGGNDLGKSEERGLKNGVGAVSEAELHGDVGSVDGVELDVVLGDILLHLGGKMLVKLFAGPGAVKQECTALLMSSTMSYLST